MSQWLVNPKRFGLSFWFLCHESRYAFSDSIKAHRKWATSVDSNVAQAIEIDFIFLSRSSLFLLSFHFSSTRLRVVAANISIETLSLIVMPKRFLLYRFFVSLFCWRVHWWSSSVGLLIAQVENVSDARACRKDVRKMVMNQVALFLFSRILNLVPLGAPSASTELMTWLMLKQERSHSFHSNWFHWTWIISCRNGGRSISGDWREVIKIQSCSGWSVSCGTFPNEIHRYRSTSTRVHCSCIEAFPKTPRPMSDIEKNQFRETKLAICHGRPFGDMCLISGKLLTIAFKKGLDDCPKWLLFRGSTLLWLLIYWIRNGSMILFGPLSRTGRDNDILIGPIIHRP